MIVRVWLLGLACVTLRVRAANPLQSLQNVGA